MQLLVVGMAFLRHLQRRFFVIVCKPKVCAVAEQEFYHGNVAVICGFV